MNMIQTRTLKKRCLHILLYFIIIEVKYSSFYVLLPNVAKGFSYGAKSLWVLMSIQSLCKRTNKKYI